MHRDHHIEVAKALYSIPGNLIGQRVDVARRPWRWCGCSAGAPWSRSIPAPLPGGRITDPADLPVAAHHLRHAAHLDALARMAAKAGPAVGAYAVAVLDHPLPWGHHLV